MAGRLPIPGAARRCRRAGSRLLLCRAHHRVSRPRIASTRRGIIRCFSSAVPARGVSESDDFLHEFEGLFVDEAVCNAAEDDAPKAPGSVGGPPLPRTSGPVRSIFEADCAAHDHTTDGGSTSSSCGGSSSATTSTSSEDPGEDFFGASNMFGECGDDSRGRTTVLNPACRELWRAAKRNCHDTRLWEQLIVDVNTSEVITPQPISPTFGYYTKEKHSHNPNVGVKRRGVNTYLVVKRQSIYLKKHDVLISFYALSKMRFRDTKFLRELGFQMVRHSASFSARELGLFFNAHKRLELHDTDNLNLLLQAYLALHMTWTAWDMALVCNAAAHFFLYEPRLWRLVSKKLPIFLSGRGAGGPASTLTTMLSQQNSSVDGQSSTPRWGTSKALGRDGRTTTTSMKPQGIALIVAAMARLDWRDPKALLLLTRAASRQADAFAPAELAVLYTGLCKLDFDAAKLFGELEESAVNGGFVEEVAIDDSSLPGPLVFARGASLESDPHPYLLDFHLSPSSQQSNEDDVSTTQKTSSERFDLHALVMMLQSCVCFTKAWERRPALVRGLVAMVRERRKNVRDHHVRKLRTARLFLQHHPDTKRTFKIEVVMLEQVLTEHESRKAEEARAYVGARRRRVSDDGSKSCDVNGTASTTGEDEQVPGGEDEQALTPPQHRFYLSRWKRELHDTLKREMNVEVEKKPLVHEEYEDLIIVPPGETAESPGGGQKNKTSPTGGRGGRPSQKAGSMAGGNVARTVVFPIGCYAYYADTTERTAHSRLHTRLLELMGYNVMHIPYYEWAEVRLLEDKILYLVSKGRRLAELVGRDEQQGPVSSKGAGVGQGAEVVRDAAIHQRDGVGRGRLTFDPPKPGPGVRRR